MDTNVITALLIDTDENATDGLAILLAEIPLVTIVGKVNDPLKAISAIGTLNPDVVFLEIDMIGKNGFEILYEMVRLQFSSKVVFCNAGNGYTIKAIRNYAFDYLLKPIEKTELMEAVFRLHTLIAANKTNVNGSDNPILSGIDRLKSYEKIQFSLGNGFIMVKPEEIFYILAEWNYSELYFSSSRFELITSNLGTVEKILQGKNFFRISRSIIINLSYIWKVNRRKRTAILQKNGEEFSCKIPVCCFRRMEKYLTNDMVY